MNFSLHDSKARRRQPVRRWLTPKLAHLAAGFLVLLTTVAEATDGMVDGALPPLLIPVESSATTRMVGPSGFPSVRPMVMHPAWIASMATWLQPDRQFRLDLLTNQDITVEVRTVEPTATGGLVVKGRATSDAASTVTLTLHGDQLTGFVALPGLGQFRIAPGTLTGVMEVSRIEGHPTGFCRTGSFTSLASPQGTLARAVTRPQSDDLPPADTLPDPTVVDVLFLYTPQAVLGEGDEESLRRRILESVDETNYRMIHSQIHVRINPVYIGLYNTFETGDLPRDNYRLANGLDGMERVPALRNDTKADLVCLVTELENQGIGGQAWDVALPKGDPASGFMVIRRLWMGAGYVVLAHELGHLLGCDHDREHAAHAGDDAYYALRKPYIFGHRLEVQGVTYIDVMSYAPGINVPYFSNPRLSLDGIPLGVSAEQARSSDGSRTINETAPYVARYRTALSRIEFAQSRWITAEHEGTGAVSLRRTGDLNTSTRVNVVINPSSSAKPGLDYIRPSVASVSFATNQATAEWVIPLLRDSVVEGEESIQLSLSSVSGEHGLGMVSTCEVVLLDDATPSAFSRVEFPDGPLSIVESAGEARIRVRLVTGDEPEPLVLPYRTVSGTAVPGVDYEAVSGTVTTTGNVSEWEIVVPIQNQPQTGPDRTFSVVVGTRTNAVRVLDEQHLGALLGNPGRSLAADGNLNARVRADGRLWVWGSFSRLAGQERTGIALLNPDGTVDEQFRPPTLLLGHRPLERMGNPSANATIMTVQPQSDGKLLLAGTFSRVNGQPRAALIRLHADGSLDEDFGKALQIAGTIYTVAVQPDGRILVGGDFEKINGIRRPFIARLMPDGAVDEEFAPKGGPASDYTTILLSLALQPDGKILLGGIFQRVDGTPLSNLARLNPDGTLDPTFRLIAGASGPVLRVRVQTDGRIVVGGVFDSLGGRPAKKLARLNSDGSNDLTFRPPNPNSDVNDFVYLPDGRLLVSGSFSSVASQDRRFLALLKADGSLDTNFNVGRGPDHFLGTVMAQGGEVTPLLANGTLYLSGPFQRFNGIAAPNLVGLNLGESAPILRDTRLSSGDLVTSVTGLPGIYPLEVSPDLEHWQPAGQVRLEGDGRKAEVHMPTAPDSAQFIRLRTPTP